VADPREGDLAGQDGEGDQRDGEYGLPRRPGVWDGHQGEVGTAPAGRLRYPGRAPRPSRHNLPGVPLPSRAMTADRSDTGWQTLPSDAPDLFDRLRALEGAEIHLHFGIGTAAGWQVDVPAASLNLRGRLQVEKTVDRFAVKVPDRGAADFAWFGRRRGRGRPDYWQGAIEHRVAGRPALVLYFTAPAGGLRLRVRAPEPPPGPTPG